MRKLYLLSTLVLFLLLGRSATAQDFSNKGKDFWVAYGYHAVMNQGNSQEMVLYFAADQNTSVTVSIPGLGWSQTYFVLANTVFTSNPMPKFAGADSRLTAGSVVPEQKGIHITSDKPIVAYAHIYNQSVSGATILFPTVTLGKEYYSVNYTNISNTTNANCWFYVIACDTGTTMVEITPSAAITTGQTPGVPFTVSLRQGEVFNVMGTFNNSSSPLAGVDLTGSFIRSVSTNGTGCKRIAVYSGSGRISLTCNRNSSSSDNYMVQAFPKSAWGKKYLTVPTGGPMPNNLYRICVTDPTTAVRVDGAPITQPLINGFYYELPLTNQPQIIEADKPIMVSQYLTSQGACNNGSPGDPEVIYLSPVEQNINKVLWNATPNFAIQEHYYNVVIPNTGTAISSFRLDGAPVPAGNFNIHPQDSRYSYMKMAVNSGQHTISSDSGFNAIAYGFGNAESYGYNAGTNIKDIYQYVSIQNQYATVDFPAACKNSPFYFSMTFPYQPTNIKWQFSGLFPDYEDASPVPVSTTIVNGRTLYKYTIPAPYTIVAAGTYPIKIIATNPTPDGCGGIQEIDYDLQVFDPPDAEFNFTHNGCISDPVLFQDATTGTNGRTVTTWNWDFGDNTTGNTLNPSHLYGSAGTFNVKYSVITDVGCLSDTAEHQVVISDPPIALFGYQTPLCAGRPVIFSDTSSVANGTIVKWHWNFGDGPTIIATSNADQVHTYAAPGNYVVTLRVETSSGCFSLLFTRNITINPSPDAQFNITPASICLPTGAAQFNSTSIISDNSVLNYEWEFGDGNTGSGQSVSHNYATAGPFTVRHIVISNQGCRDTLEQAAPPVYAEPQAAFTAPAEVCHGTTITFNESSTAPGSTITQWSWNFGDGNNSTVRNPTHTYAAPGTYTVTLSVTSAAGCVSVNNIATQTITVNSLPTADFNFSLPGCIGKDVTFTSTSVPNSGTLTEWIWNFGDGNTITATNGNPVTHSYAIAQSYNVTLQVKNDKGCLSTIVSKPVAINVLPVADFVPPVACANDVNAQFQDASSVSTGAIVAWQWNFGDPNANAGNPNTSTLQNPTHHYTVAGTYTAELIAFTASGCSDTITKTFTINSANPVSNFNIVNAGPLCSNRDVTIQDASSIAIGNILKIEIFWDYGNDPTIVTVDNSPLAGRNYTHTYPEFGTPASKNVTIRYVVHSGDNCLTIFDRVVTLLATPSLVFNTVPGVCDDAAAFQITQAQMTNGLPGNGVFSGNGVSPTGLFNPQTAGVGAHNITYTFTGTNSCVNTISGIVEVNPVPAITAGPDKFVLEGGVVTLTPSLNSGVTVTYLWSPPEGLNNPTISHPESSPTRDMTYTLTVTSDKGCVNSDEVLVKLLKAPVIPNIFSPNGDGINDRWVIEFLDSYPGCVVQIFNRYGQLIHRVVNYTTPWDGKISGKDAPVGTYYYIIDPKNGRKPMTGFVDIIR